MCGLCPDFVAYCGEGDCLRRTGKATVFYIGDALCEHLAERDGTSIAGNEGERP